MTPFTSCPYCNKNLIFLYIIPPAIDERTYNDCRLNCPASFRQWLDPKNNLIRMIEICWKGYCFVFSYQNNKFEIFKIKDGFNLLLQSNCDNIVFPKNLNELNLFYTKFKTLLIFA